MDDLSQRVANLSPAKRKLLLAQLGKEDKDQPSTRLPHNSAMTVEELKAEASLDPTISPENVPVGATIKEPVAILLTGSTGFIGAFLLAELLKQTSADIYCLVRAAKDEEVKEIIRANMASYLVWDESQSFRIIPILGDLSKPLLGLSTQQFSWLTNHIDVIYHNGALVKWTYPYRTLKATNVVGTQEILRLACQAKVKPVHFISTIGVFSSPTFGSDTVHEEENLENSGSLSVGYAQSKWVAEKLVRIAGCRGLPISIYRPGTGGHSQTGVFNVKDYACILIKGCVQLGCALEMDMELPMAPVDYVSKAIIYLSKQKESIGKTFHLVNPHSITWTKLLDWMSDFGYSLPRIPYDRWKAMLANRVNVPTDNALYSFSPFFSESLFESSKLPHFDCQNTLDALAGTSITCPPVDSQLLNIYFSYFSKSSFLDAPQCCSVKKK